MAVTSDRDSARFAAIENAMLVHAAFGGSTNLLLHIPAIAATAGLRTPTVEDWIRVNRATPRLVDALPLEPVRHGEKLSIRGIAPMVLRHFRLPVPEHMSAGRQAAGAALAAALP